jgi:hypothetical protein
VSPVFEELGGGSFRLRVKAIPGASRNEIAGALGDRLKIKVAAPPEGGKANKAILALLAKEFGVRKQAVALESGQTNPEKTFLIDGATRTDLEALAG